MGYRVVAVAQDLPAHLRKTKRASELSATFLSDPRMTAATAYGLSWTQTDERYLPLLEEFTGEDHHLLPVPAVYIVGADRQIDFVYSNVIYQARPAPSLVLEAAKSFVREEE